MYEIGIACMCFLLLFLLHHVKHLEFIFIALNDCYLCWVSDTNLQMIKSTSWSNPSQKYVLHQYTSFHSEVCHKMGATTIVT